MYYTTDDQVSIYYEVHGQSGSPLLLIQGFGGAIGDWVPEHIDALSQKHQVILFDNRGAGRSDKPATPYTMAQFAADTIGLLTALQLNHAHIFGVSMGGMIAQHLAVNYPDRVAALILGCTTAVSFGHPAFAPPAQEVLMELTKPPSGNRAQEIEAGWKLCFTSSFIEQNSDHLARVRQRALAYPECPPYARQLQFEAVVHTHNLYEQISQLQCPTLIQCGTEDLLLPVENSRTLARLIPGARLIEYPGCGHRYMEEGGEKTLYDLLVFLDEVDGSKK